MVGNKTPRPGFRGQEALGSWVWSPMEDEVRTREGPDRDQLRPRAAVIPEVTPPASLSPVTVISCPVKEGHPILQMTLNPREVPWAQASK